MDQEELEWAVRRLVGGHLGIPASAVLLSAEISDDLGADSLDRMELIMTVEERFGVAIPEQDQKGIATVGDLVTVVHSQPSST